MQEKKSKLIWYLQESSSVISSKFNDVLNVTIESLDTVNSSEIEIKKKAHNRQDQAVHNKSITPAQANLAEKNAQSSNPRFGRVRKKGKCYYCGIQGQYKLVRRKWKLIYRERNKSSQSRERQYFSQDTEIIFVADKKLLNPHFNPTDNHWSSVNKWSLKAPIKVG